MNKGDSFHMFCITETDVAPVAPKVGDKIPSSGNAEIKFNEWQDISFDEAEYRAKFLKSTEERYDRKLEGWPPVYIWTTTGYDTGYATVNQGILLDVNENVSLYKAYRQEQYLPC